MDWDSWNVVVACLTDSRTITEITDGTTFCVLLSTCHNPAACLEALTAKNLCHLLNTSNSDFASAVAIARAVLANKAHFEAEEAPYQRALWVILLHDDTVDTVSKLARLTDGKAAQPGVPNLLRCLQWANRYAHTQENKQVKHGLDKLARERLLRQALVLCSYHAPNARKDPKASQIQLELWGEAFAPLLWTPSGLTESVWQSSPQRSSPIFDPPDALAVDDLRVWLPVVEKSTAWPQEIQLFSDLMKCRAQAPRGRVGAFP